MTSQPRRRPRPQKTEVLYARMPADLVEWIRQQAIRADVSMAQAAASILAYCRDAGLTLQPRRVPVVAAIAVPDHSRTDLASTRASDPLARGIVS